jgi:mannose-1-phosphate guanylyltransferase
MGSFAADHLVVDQAAFVRTIEAAVRGAGDGLLMTVGITPTGPDTGFGYLECASDGPQRTVVRFKEKPTREVAEAYLATGRYLWNAGMFVWRVDVFLGELARQQPALAAGLHTIAAAWGTPEQDRVLGEVWPALPRISVDHAVMEGAADAGLVGTVPGDFGWTDIGDFDTLGTVLAAGADEADEAGNVVVAEAKDAPVILRDTERTVVVGQSGRLVVALGVRDLVVVDTPDALMVCDRARAEDIKVVVDELKARGEQRYL